MIYHYIYICKALLYTCFMFWGPGRRTGSKMAMGQAQCQAEGPDPEQLQLPLALQSWPQKQTKRILNQIGNTDIANLQEFHACVTCVSYGLALSSYPFHIFLKKPRVSLLHRWPLAMIALPLVDERLLRAQALQVNEGIETIFFMAGHSGYKVAGMHQWTCRYLATCRLLTEWLQDHLLSALQADCKLD